MERKSAIDREKVIKDNAIRGLQSSIEISGALVNLRKEHAEALLALLKEQEAVKPKSESRNGEYPQIVHRCGNCNAILNRYYKYCPTCGRSVKWE